jgi:hypothetical protein
MKMLNIKGPEVYTAIRDYRCDKCGRYIHTGMQYRKVPDDDKLGYTNEHLDCTQATRYEYIADINFNYRWRERALKLA